MNVYQSIKNFGKKALLVGGLVMALAGCEQPPRVNQVLADVNRDGKKDIVFYMMDLRGRHNIYLSINENGSFSKAEKIINIWNRPTELQVEDLDGDGNHDISYVMMDLRGRWNMYLAKGNGDGTFQNSVRIRHYLNCPN